jgi:trehalose monomycolate/heme transporter
MFTRWGLFVARARWWVLAAGVLLVLVGAAWGSGVFGVVSGGGFNDPGSPSQRVREQITREFGETEPDIIVLYQSGTHTVDEPAFRAPVTAALASLSGRPEVAGVASWYSTGSPAYVATDRHATYAAITLRAGPDDQKLADFQAIRDALRAGGGIRTEFGGARPFEADANALTASDIQRAEALSLPILLVLLVVIFGSVVSAASPLLIGGVAILGAFTVTRLLSEVTDVSTFAVNIITLIGLGLSIDYALFVVSRFREELAGGTPVREAVGATMATSGRTVAVSGVVVTLALASLLLFPQGFLKSMAYGGMAAVAVAMLASLTVLPAWLAVLGPRINAWRLPLPGRGNRINAGWARLAHSVMRRPWWYLAGSVVVLAVLAAPVTHIRFGGVDVRVLPAGIQSREVADTIAARFPQTSSLPMLVLTTGVDQAGASVLAAQISALPAVADVRLTANRGDSTVFTVDYAGDPNSPAAQQVVREIRALRAPSGARVGVTGYTADLADQLHGLGSRLPWMVLVVVLVALVLLFAAFGSVVLPVKAVLMNLVSLGAAFGVVVFIFQDGHFASWLGYTATGFIEPTDPILMVAVLFGLATDYEVFLLSRVREEWDAGADNASAVATGMQNTGRIITSAALLLIVVVVGFSTGRTAFIKLIGVGMIAAILVDVTLVRALLVPATMRLLGRWNWWAPGLLGQLVGPSRRRI